VPPSARRGAGQEPYNSEHRGIEFILLPFHGPFTACAGRAAFAFECAGCRGQVAQGHAVAITWAVNRRSTLVLAQSRWRQNRSWQAERKRSLPAGMQIHRLGAASRCTTEPDRLQCLIDLLISRMRVGARVSSTCKDGLRTGAKDS
jgi:hypothetical protein